MNENEYTPDTSDIFECVCGEGAIGYTAAEFARWLASVKAEVWEECRDAISRDAFIDWTVETPPANPYRADELEGK